MSKNKISASVLAFEKKLVPSDALMYGTTWQNRKTQATALKLQEKSVRGTISNRLKKSDEGKIDAKIESANLQKVDSCSLSPEQDTLKLSFTLKILSGVENPSACNSEEFNETYKTAVKKYINNYSFNELSKRYAINLANGRFLWRNRVGCENTEVQIKILNKEQDFDITFNSKEFVDFDSSNQDILQLSQKIADTLSGKNDFLLLEINAYAQVGKLQDVYPSEELVLDKNNSKDKKSKILFHVEETAAIHSQKIGNAIRTIDTWYPEFEKNNRPIAADPYGAVTNLGKAYRKPADKVDFFTLFNKFSTGEEIEKNEQHFVMSVLVRGGVFGEKQ